MINPVRLCCGKRHTSTDSVICPDGKVMCCLCFDRFSKEELWTEEDGSKVDVCISCGEQEKQAIIKRQQSKDEKANS